MASLKYYDSIDEQIPSIFLARYPEWLNVAAKVDGFNQEKLKESRSNIKKFKAIGGFNRFIVSWDKSMITQRNIGYVRTVLEWINHYDMQIWTNEGKIVIATIPQDDIYLTFGTGHDFCIINTRIDNITDEQVRFILFPFFNRTFGSV